MENKIPQEESTLPKFGGSDNDCSTYEKSRVVIVPVPYGKTVSYKRGTEKGPAAILKASEYMELFDEELGKETYRIGIHATEELGVRDLSPEDMISQVEKKVSGIIRDSKFPVIIGGEHTVSIGAVKALLNSNKDLTVLYLDAHYDLRDSLHGSGLSHGCTARRLSEMCRVILVGARSLSKEEKNFLPNPNVTIFNAYDILDMPNWREKIKDAVSDNIYISIDLDVFDPSIMPAVGTPEPGGFGWYEILDLLRYITQYKNVLGADIVELCPIEGITASDFMAAKLIYRLLGYNFILGHKRDAPKKEQNGSKKETTSVKKESGSS